MSYTVVQGRRTHIAPVANGMSIEDKDHLARAGFTPRSAVRRMFLDSCRVWTAVMDGRPVAMWGIRGPMMADSGEAWLVLTGGLRRRPFAVVKEAMRGLAKMLEIKREITSSMICFDKRACRFAEALGFTIVSQGETYGMPIFRGVLRR